MWEEEHWGGSKIFKQQGQKCHQCKSCIHNSAFYINKCTQGLTTKVLVSKSEYAWIKGKTSLFIQHILDRKQDHL